MTLWRLNLAAAVLSLCGAVLLLILGEPAGALVWLAASLVWLVIAVLRLRDPHREAAPARRLGRWFSRLFLFGS